MVVVTRALSGCVTDADPAPTDDIAAGYGHAVSDEESVAGDAPDIAEPCGTNDACALGLTCARYFGISGSAGPQLDTCELHCKADSDCPSDRHCIVLADGPGHVCR